MPEYERAPETEGESADNMPRPLEELTVAELAALFVRAPIKTARRFSAAMKAPARASFPPAVAIPDTPAVADPARARNARGLLPALRKPRARRRYAQLLLYALAILFAIGGSDALRINGMRAGGSTVAGAASILLGIALWLAAEMLGRWQALRFYWRRLPRGERQRQAARALPVLLWLNALFVFIQALAAAQDASLALAAAAFSRFVLGIMLWLAIDGAHRLYRARSPATDNMSSASAASSEIPAERQSLLAFKLDGFPWIGRGRIALLCSAIACSGIVWLNTSGNHIALPTIALWLVSAALWAFVFAPAGWNIFDWATEKVDAFRRFRWRDYRGIALALVLILVLGASFRFDRLAEAPSEMFSDLVEKIQDAYKIYYQDDYRIFLENIGGREPLHFYLLSILATQPGMHFDHYALKLMSALESVLTIPLLYLLAKEVIGQRRRRLGSLLGLAAAGLMAVSFWHVVIGRQGMRISLAPFFTALTALFFARALRGNQRADYVKAGLALGFGLYGYQAARMLPVPIVAGVLLTLLLRKYPWRTVLEYLLNLAVLAFVSLMVFLPMLHYWQEYPENYQRRTSTRIFGDNPTGEEDALQALLEGGASLLRNTRNVLLMYHYTGDSTWVTGLPGEPAMDATTAGFMALGLAAWLALMLSTRDPSIVFVPVLVFFMLMASALALAFPIEVPSFARASGAIPPSYLIAALPVCIFCRQLYKTLPRRIGKLAAVIFAAAVILSANQANTSLYFDRFAPYFARSSHPYTQAGAIVRGFAESDGAYGNAIPLSSPHWWDYRAVGIEAGKMFWDNGTAVEDLRGFLERGLQREPEFRLQPERDLLFFYDPSNQAAAEQLAQWFPQGRLLTVEAHSPARNFVLYRVPALGRDAVRTFIDGS